MKGQQPVACVASQLPRPCPGTCWSGRGRTKQDPVSEPGWASTCFEGCSFSTQEGREQPQKTAQSGETGALHQAGWGAEGARRKTYGVDPPRASTVPSAPAAWSGERGTPRLCSKRRASPAQTFYRTDRFGTRSLFSRLRLNLGTGGLSPKTTYLPRAASGTTLPTQLPPLLERRLRSGGSSPEEPSRGGFMGTTAAHGTQTNQKEPLCNINLFLLKQQSHDLASSL